MKITIIAEMENNCDCLGMTCLLHSINELFACESDIKIG